MRYWIGKASPSFVGAEEEWKFKAENEEDAMDFFRDTGVQHIEGYESPSQWEEENDIEYEYNIHVEEISEKEYNESDIQVLE